MSQKSHSRRRRTMDRTARAKARAKRRPFIETLEDRRLMTVNLDDPRLSYPPIGNFTADLPAFLSPSEYKSRSQSSVRTPGTVTTGAGESPSDSQRFEQEPNDLPIQANSLNVGSGAGQLQTVTVTGFLTATDEDHFSANLRAGDFLKVEFLTPRLSADVSVTEPSGSELMGSTFNQLLSTSRGGSIPDNSPMVANDATVAFGGVIQTSGVHTFRVGNGGGSYNLRLTAFRSALEAEAIGTRQILYLDFNGATFNGNIFGLGNTVRLPSLIDTVEPFGVAASEENLLIDRIVERVRQNYLGTLASQGGNGYFNQSGVPGQFDIDIRNSRDNADPWGLPNVSRVIIGGGIFDLGIPTRGIAQSVDVGNFKRDETAVVLPEVYFLEDIQDIPLAASKSLIDILGFAIAQTASHEAGHFFGARHQENSNANRQLMDSGGQPLDVSRIGVGRDGTFGTFDDVNITFGRDRYAIGEGMTGSVNHAVNLAYALTTGTRGGTVTGIVFNDANRNALQDGGEGTLSGWQVFVDLNNNGSRDAGEPTGTTDSSGRYSLGVGAGTYNVRVVYPAGWIASTDSEAAKAVTVSVGSTANANFGASFPQVGATGFKWLDLNGDGVRDQNEPGLAGVYIYLDLDLDGRPDIGEPAAITKDDGSYTLSPPNPGTFRIREVVEPGYVQTFPTSGFHTAVFNGNTPLSGFDFGNRESSDWGDAPSPYPTTRAQGGASHGVLPGFRLGANWDAELDGANSANADGDDLNAAVDDEDGITLLSPIVRGDSQNSIRISVVNTASSAAYLQGWIDFNGNGSWGDPGERIVSDLPASAGDTIVNFTTPASAVSRTAARFRLSATTGVGPTGRTPAGEVEDYIFNIVDGPRRNVQDDRFTVNRNSISNPLDVLANDFLPPNDSIAAIQLSAPNQGGSVSVGASNILRYTPARGFFGQESFTYTIVFGSGRRETANVTVSVVLQFIDPVALDDSFDIPTNSTSFPLNVLLNDIEGKNGPLTITGVSTPNQGGSVVIGSGGLSIRYTPQNGFGGTERFTYTAVDGAGKTTTANVTVHTLGGDRLDDEVQFSFSFFDMSGNPISRVLQGDQFQVYVYTYDLRREKAIGVVPAPPPIVDPGVFAAYLDVLYNSKIVLPASPSGGTPLDFANSPQNNYTSGVSGTAQFPGVLQSLGAFYSLLSPPPFSLFNPTLFQKLTFTANAAGLAEFVGDPANQSPNTDVVLYNPPTSPVPVEKVRYLRSTIEVLPRGVELPFAVDDSPAALPLNTTSVIDVLRNDIVGTAGPIQISSLTQPARGTVSIDTRGTSSTSDDRIQFIPFSSTIGFSDQFTYTIMDTRGFSSTATVTIQVGDSSVDDQVRLVLETHAVGAPANAAPISTIPVGGEFELRGYVQDIRTPAPTGVFAAYQDILYDAGLVAVKSSSGPLGFEITFSSKYPNGPSGDVRIPGLINEVGSFADTTPIGSGKFEQFRIKMKANTAGNARFAGDPADISPFNDTLVYGSRDKIPYNRISFVPATITIGGTSSGGGEGHTNPNNRFDVNSDNFVSPIDVLLLINLLNQGQGGALETRPSGGPAEGEDGDNYYVDVDSDGFFTPLDALLIINELNGRAISGEGEGAAPPIVEIRSTASQRSDASIEISLTDSLAVAVGPQMASSNASASINDVDGYLASLVDGDDEEEEGVDDFLGDLVRVRFQS